MDDDTGSSGPTRTIGAFWAVLACAALAALCGGPQNEVLAESAEILAESAKVLADSVEGLDVSGADLAAAEASNAMQALLIYLPFILALILLSGFFSASEVAFFSIQRLRLRGLRESGGFTGRLVAEMMDHPGRLLTTILVGNMIVNTLIAVLLPFRMQRFLESVPWFPSYMSYPFTIALCTALLVFFGEVAPKVFAVRVSEVFARAVAVPMRTVDFILAPVRWAVLGFTDFLFRVTRFNDIKAAPFITDEEFKSVLSVGEVHGVIEEEGRQMIQGILEFRDAQLREILVPRPDVVALSEEATVGEALELFREREFSRMPVYRGDLDHVTGVLFAKDLLPSVVKERLDSPIRDLARPARFVPETMTIHGFVKDAQRMRRHLAIVVDEYGGTEGIVTLEDAIEEVVGDISDEEEEAKPLVERLESGRFRVDGGLPLDELSDLLGIDIEDEKHETVAGFFMERTNKIPATGDTVEHRGAIFTVEEVDGKRASRVSIEVLDKSHREKKT